MKLSWRIPNSQLFICPSAFLQWGIAESEKNNRKGKGEKKYQNPHSFLWYKHKICLKRRSVKSYVRSKATGVKFVPAAASCTRATWCFVAERAACLIPALAAPRCLRAHGGTPPPCLFMHQHPHSSNFILIRPYSSGHYSYPRFDLPEPQRKHFLTCIAPSLTHMCVPTHPSAPSCTLPAVARIHVRVCGSQTHLCCLLQCFPLAFVNTETFLLLALHPSDFAFCVHITGGQPHT